jgi:hypothetical protein
MSAATDGLGTTGMGHVAAQRRFARVAEQVRAIRGRSGIRPDTWMLYVGGALMPLGILLIVLGWLGAARTPFAFEQTPYLISGGVLGLGLVVSGGFVYFGYWQSLRIRESRQQSLELTAVMSRLESLLTAVGSAAGGGTLAGAAYVATPSGSIFHRPDCTVVAGRDDLSAVDAATTKLEACRICSPLDTADSPAT